VKLLPTGHRPGPDAAWLLLLLALLLIVFLMGWAWKRTPLGILVGSRNVASLSGFQLVLWTVLLCSLLLAVAWWHPGGLDPAGHPLRSQGFQVGAATGTAAVATGILAAKRRRVPSEEALVEVAKGQVAMQPEEEALRLVQTAKPAEGDAGSLHAKVVAERLVPMAASLHAPAKAAKATAVPGPPKAPVGEVLAAVQESAYEPDLPGNLAALLEGRMPEALVPALDALGLPPEELRAAVKRLAQANALHALRLHRTGTVYRNLCPCEARLGDMLEGDEITDQDAKQGSKVQFLLFTLAGLVAFGATAWHAFHGSGFGGVEMPTVPQGLSEVLAFSGAGYLGAKAPNKTA
jgi:hypothetical protein